MIELSGLTVRDELNPDGDVPIEITGLRPGEKLFEELLIGDNPLQTSHPRIMRAQDEFVSWPVLENKLKELSVALETRDVQNIRSLLAQLVPDYTPSEGVVDWVYIQKNNERAEPNSNLYYLKYSASRNNKP
jgi:FlaA1/EpsC-like NDP-sugar epimerase